MNSNESNFFFLDPVTSVEIDPPHAVVVGEEAWFNVTFYTSGGPDPEEYKPSYGYVHFMWIFDNVSEPVLTLNHAVSHVFSTTGQFDVTVQAISLVSSKASHVSITVYGMCDTVTWNALRKENLKQSANSFSRNLRCFVCVGASNKGNLNERELHIP